MAIILSNGLLTELKTATQTTNLQFGDLVGKIQVTIDNGAGGGGSGVGEWYFYSDEGTINADPPVADGNAIFTINTDGPTLETFNPNKSGGVTYLYLNVKDSSGTDYTTQFNTLTDNGGTITLSQNGDTATYTSTSEGSFMIQNIGGGNFFVIATGGCTQPKESNNPYVFSDPISITIS